MKDIIGLEKVWYPGILVTSQFQIWQPIFGWAEGPASHQLRVNSQTLAGPVAQRPTFESKQPMAGWSMVQLANKHW